MEKYRYHVDMPFNPPGFTQKIFFRKYGILCRNNMHITPPTGEDYRQSKTAQPPYWVLPQNPDGTLGVDMGIVNLAVTSDGDIFSGDKCMKTRQKYATLKRRLQPVKTWNAKKHLKRISSKERRFKKDTDHCIAKQIVSIAKDTRRAIALEDLKGIRKSGRTVSKELRTSIGKWAFYELGTFIQYKAQMEGVPIYFVDPKYTSQQCSECGFISKSNRKTQSEFVCLECGHSENADVNAAKNISFRADVNRPIALRSSGLKEESWKGKPTTLVMGS